MTHTHTHLCIYLCCVGVGVAESVSSVTMDWTARVQSLTGRDDFSSSFCIQTGSGAHPEVGARGFFPGGKAWPGCDADHSPASSAEVKKEYSYTSSHPNAPLWSIMGPLYFFLFMLCTNLLYRELFLRNV
jgi:hypothetical protein